jgi:hypothetical protein
MIKYLILFLILPSCTILPTYDMYEIEYCKKIRGVIYCDNGAEINMKPIRYDCSIYDTEGSCGE